MMSEAAASSGVDRRRADLVFFALATVALGTFLWLAREMTFRIDEWDFVLNRRLDDPIGLLTPFNEQWVTVPAVIFRTIFAVVGLHTYLPYLIVLLLLHLVVAAGTRAVVRAVAGEAIGLAAGVTVLFLGIGYENLNQGFQIGMVLSAACGIWVIALLVIDRRPRAAAVHLLL